MSEFIIGSIIEFGGYAWRILDKKDDFALIITEDMIGQQSFNNYSGEVTWKDCSLRKYLNEEFYNEFTVEERSKINPVINKNHGNQWYGSEGGEDTNDYIFLLSMEEAVCQYFGDSRNILENPSNKQKYWFQKKDENNSKRMSRFQGYMWWWWLRSPGRDNKRVVYIHGDGNIGIQGNSTFRYSSKTIHPLTGDNCGGVRPALWLNLKL